MKGFKTGKNRKQNRAAKILLGFAAAVGFIVLGKSAALAGTAEMNGSISEAVEATGAVNPANPVHHCTKDTDSTGNTDTTTWSYVYFGSYPQSEVTGSALTSTITGASYDANGDAWVNGTKYRRISKSDTNNANNFGDSTYRYFKWERIKWRVLKNDGSTLFVMADKGLDSVKYYEVPNTWENCSLRNWLNNNFYKTAFSSKEKKAVVKQKIVNEDTRNTEGGNNTVDKVFLMSISEALNSDYGFCEMDNVNFYSYSRRVKASDYAHARGVRISTSGDYVGNCAWWLRSPGSSWYYPSCSDGSVSTTWSTVSGEALMASEQCKKACVPVLHINLSSNLWSATDDGTSGAGGSLDTVPTVTAPDDQRVVVGTSVTFFVMARGWNSSSYTYQWFCSASQDGEGTEISGATSSVYTISEENVNGNLDGQYYYCVVSNGQDDVESDRAKLTVITELSPLHHCTGENDGSDYTDWDYVYFGSYPQSEVTGSALTSAITGASYDANGDAWVNGTKYRRISKNDTKGDDEWFGSNAYRYFKWERIKWRVLKNDGSTLFVMADKGLDCKNYHDSANSVTWETCTLRKWLNSNFYETAFSSKEQHAVVQQNIINGANLEGLVGGNNTTDKVFLLSVSEALNPDYGFCGTNIGSVSRRAKVSDYAHMRGGVARLYLRSPGYSHAYVAYIFGDGVIDSYIASDRVCDTGYHTQASDGKKVYHGIGACVPALYINLSSDLWSMTDDGTSGAGGSLGNTPPTITAPVGQSVEAGNSAAFFVVASGGTPSNYTYQWYYAASQGGLGTRISGATSSVYTIPASEVTESLNGRYYYCVVSNGAYDVESGRAKLTVQGDSGQEPPDQPVPPDVSDPTAQEVKLGNNAIFSVEASGGNPTSYTYQWYFTLSQSGEGTRIDGATSPFYIISAGEVTENLNGRYYYCVVSNGAYDVESGRARLTVQSESGQEPSDPSSPPTVSGLEEWYDVAAGTSLSLSVTASGGSPSSYTYQWCYASSETGEGTEISGATSPDYTIPPSEMTESIHGRYYYCVISNGAYSVESRRTRILVHKDTTPGGSQTGGNQNTGGGNHTSSDPKPQNINANSCTVAYGSKAAYLGASTDGDGALTYQSSNPKVAEVLPDGRVKTKSYGTAVITISASQTASYAAASKQVTIQVVPKSGVLKQASSPYSRSLKLTWKKDKKAGGYEVQISMSKSFRSKTIKRLYPKGKTGITLVGLQSKKKYFVRTRSYAKVGKQKIYGDWSKVKTVKIR